MERAVFARHCGFRLAAVGEGVCTLHVPFQPALERPGGLIGGPVFMGAARREDFFCTARILKLGRRLVYGVAECVTSDGRLLTHHTVTYVRPEERTGC